MKNLFVRDEETHCMKWGEFMEDEVEYLYENRWVATEKIDGTNIRIHWIPDEEKKEFVVDIRGHSDKSETPKFLMEVLQNHPGLQTEKFLEAEMPEMILFGEGYGEKIQKGGAYLQGKQDFILFDVFCGSVWLQRIDVCDVADKLGIKAVPTIGIKPLDDLVRLATRGFQSYITEHDKEAEGLVCTPEVPMLNRQGSRIICKLKTKDLRKVTDGPHI
jgi:hypothetical protein